jgi:hypothetical protein
VSRAPKPFLHPSKLNGGSFSYALERSGKGKYRIGFGHNFLLLPFALAVATWLAWPIYGAAVNTGKMAP